MANLGTDADRNKSDRNKLSDADLNKLAGDLRSRDYPNFFRNLFRKDADVHIDEAQLDHDKYGAREIIYKLLKKWQQVDEEYATKYTVIEALREFERNDLADQYSELWDMINKKDLK